MRIASFNLYWLGNPEKITRTADEEARVGRVLASLDADIVCLEEVCDFGALARVLAAARDVGGRAYATRDRDGAALASDEGADARRQKVVIAYDPRSLEVEAWTRVRGAAGREPVAARFRDRARGERFVVAGVHLQAGYPDFADAGDSAARRAQCEALRRWLEGRAGAEHPGLRSPEAGEPAVIAGDFNALRESDAPEHEGVVRSLDPLRALAGYRWDAPREDARGGGAVTSHTDRIAIDHVVVSPAWAASATPPRIVAFDLDELGEGRDPARVSDHRPVVIDVAP